MDPMKVGLCTQMWATNGQVPQARQTNPPKKVQRHKKGKKGRFYVRTQPWAPMAKWLSSTRMMLLARGIANPVLTMFGRN